MRQLEKLIQIWQMCIKGEALNVNNISQIQRMLSQQKELDQEEIGNKSEVVRKRYYLLLQKIESQVQSFIKNNPGIAEKKTDKMLNTFIEKLGGIPSQECVFIFSGTAHIQRIKGNRPIRMALAFEKEKVPVIYSYWRWQKTDLVPEYPSEYLIQLPIDETMRNLMDIIKAPIPQKHKIFIFEFPYPPVTRYLEIFKYYGWKVIYDIRDDWEEFQKVGQARWYQKAHEIYTIEAADCTVAVSKRLTDKFKEETKKEIKLLPNALDGSFKQEVGGERRTKIGYVGHLTSSWFDWQSLIAIANGLPHYTFEIIGHSMPQEIKNIPYNIQYLGPKTFEEIQNYASSWRIGIIPFKMNLLTMAVDPIKVYEYLSMGLKVVSFDMPQIKDYPEVKLAYNIQEFIAHIEKAMGEPFDEDKVRNFLKDNTWEERVRWIRGCSKG